MLLTFGLSPQISSNFDRINERNLLHLQEIGTSAKQSQYRRYTDVQLPYELLRRGDINAACAQFACG